MFTIFILLGRKHLICLQKFLSTRQKYLNVFYDILRYSKIVDTKQLNTTNRSNNIANILVENMYKTLLRRKRLKNTMNAEDENLPTVADSSAKNAFEIGKENYHKQKQKNQTQLQTIRQVTTLHLKQQESDSGH